MTVWDGPTVSFWANGVRCEISFRVAQGVRQRHATKRLEVMIGSNLYGCEIYTSTLLGLGLALVRAARRK